MNSKLFTSTVVAASLLAPAVAFAQAEKSEPAPKAVHHSVLHHSVLHHSASSQGGHFRAGTTTGLASSSASRARPGGQSVARKPSGN